MLFLIFCPPPFLLSSLQWSACLSASFQKALLARIPLFNTRRVGKPHPPQRVRTNQPALFYKLKNLYGFYLYNSCKDTVVKVSLALSSFDSWASQRTRESACVLRKVASKYTCGIFEGEKKKSYKICWCTFPNSIAVMNLKHYNRLLWHIW